MYILHVLRFCIFMILLCSCLNTKVSVCAEVLNIYNNLSDLFRLFIFLILFWTGGNSFYTWIKLVLFCSTALISSEKLSWMAGSFLLFIRLLLFNFVTVVSFPLWQSFKTFTHSCFSLGFSALKQSVPVEFPILSPCGVRVNETSLFSVIWHDFSRKNAHGFFQIQADSL